MHEPGRSACIGPEVASAIDRVAALFEQAGVAYAVIGAHAVNAWIEPRLTADIDVTALLEADALARLEAAFAAAGMHVTHAEGRGLPSGPDFVRFGSVEGTVVVEIQAAKTELQRTLIERAILSENGVRVATPEDLIVLKLIANRAKDQIDLLGLVALPSLDWAYVEHRAAEWEVLPPLKRVRGR
jgi:hypothetical protein